MPWQGRGRGFAATTGARQRIGISSHGKIKSQTVFNTIRLWWGTYHRWFVLRTVCDEILITEWIVCDMSSQTIFVWNRLWFAARDVEKFWTRAREIKCFGAVLKYYSHPSFVFHQSLPLPSPRRAPATTLDSPSWFGEETQSTTTRRRDTEELLVCRRR